MANNILLHSLTIILVMGIFILFMRSLNLWMCLKIFKAKVENQLGKKIKVVKSDRGGEYYNRYDGSGEQRPWPFAKFLEESGIVPQYIIPGKPSMNDVAKRRSHTINDMVTTIISQFFFVFTWITLGKRT